MFITDVNTPPPTDAQFAKLVARAQRTPLFERSFRGAPVWSLVVIFATACILMVGTQSETFSLIVNSVFSVAILGFVVLAIASARITPRLWADKFDRIAQRPDLAANTEFASTLVRPADDGLEPLDDADFAQTRTTLVHHSRTQRLFSVVTSAFLAWVMWPWIPEYLGVTRDESDRSGWVILVVAALLYLAYMRLSSRKRLLEQALATRPDLVRSTGTFLSYRSLGMLQHEPAETSA